MEERQSNKAGGVGGVVLLFLVGFVGALVVGWWVFPQLLFSQKTQPILFSHKVHAEQGLDCESCHTFSETGQFLGLPSTASCAECHPDETGGATDAEKEIDKFVKDYAKPGIEVPWLVYQYQPDNVFFSHAAHTGFECTTCHPDVANMDSPPPYHENRLSGYSKQTMKMWECERCHAQMGASNACYVCHK
ncbi:menaquinone reductase multiheme cytochrome c subunit QrcA [Desulfolutivibrio sp.]|uniref:menaquinone reductase multiheme cytochrome c subunit QrcA n=1 Tax=Desulfolutivibrio sp. TaxID=2773296 RepID=UPI002F96387C